MLNNQKYYWGTTRKAIVAFGNLFSAIQIMREDGKGKVQTVNVPIGYGPKDKMLARLNQQPDLDQKPVQSVVPRMAFEIGGFGYDNNRKLNSNVQQTSIVNGSPVRKYTGVPYSLGINLYVLTKSQDEGLQIIEQILPSFRPTYALAMNSIPEMGLTEDLYIKLESVNVDDNYEGSLSDQRVIVWTLSFVLQLNYHPASNDNQRGLIKRVEVGIFADKAMTDKDVEIATEVVPFDSDPTDDYKVVTTFEGFD